MNLSFAGCGFLGIYHVGVAVAFKKYAPHLLLEKIGGASAGALAATCLLCDMPLGELTSDFFRVVNEARSHKLKAFSPNFNIQNCLLEGLEKFLPANAHELVNGKLHISLTRFWGRKNVIVSHFDSREELLQALLCACWIPVFSGYVPPKFRGVSYMDGAFSDNLPVLDENTITVSPFCGESDICPRDDSAQLFHVNLANTSIEVSMENMGRLRRILVPCLPEELSDMCQQGFDDALQFLHRNNLISCTRCLAVQSTFVVQETVHDTSKKHFDPKCTECVRHRTEAMDSNTMPETVLTVFQTYIESANIGLAKWIFRHRGWRLLEALKLPATVPADMICATLTKLLATAPCIRDRFWHLADFLIDQINALNSIVQSHRTQKMSANISCQLSLSETGKKKAKAITHRSSKLDILINDTEIVSTIDRTQPSTFDDTPSDGFVASPAIVSSTTKSSDDSNGAVIEPHHNEHRDNEPQPNANDDTPNATDAYVPNHHHYHPHHHHHQQGDVDSFDHILQTTSHHEAVYAYYYMDENHKVKVTEIFDMTDNEDPDMQTLNERTLNQQLQFDASEWGDSRAGGSASDLLYAESAFGAHDFVDQLAHGSASAGHHHRRRTVATGDDDGFARPASADLAGGRATRRSRPVISRPLVSRPNVADADAYDALFDGNADDDSAVDSAFVRYGRYYDELAMDDDGHLDAARQRPAKPTTIWSDDDDDDERHDDEETSPHNCSDPEVDQQLDSSTAVRRGSASIVAGPETQLSDRATRALMRSTQLHLMF